MIRHFVNEKGFTLMELLIAVAIVVILAGVGIPIYLKFQAGAKHAEASTNLTGIKLSEEAYKLANGTYLACTAAPRAANAVNQNAVAWSGAGTGFDTIGFSTSADVRFAYAVAGVTTTAFVAGARGDTDADGSAILFIATEVMGPHVIGSDARDAALALPANMTVADTAD